MARKHQIFYAGVGIHPMEARDPVDDDTYSQLEAIARDESKVICISEVGLDYLPESQEAAAKLRAREEAVTDLRGSETILLVEDNEQVRELAQVILEEQGYKVLSAENGAESLKLMDAHQEQIHAFGVVVAWQAATAVFHFARLAQVWKDPSPPERSTVP